MPGGIALQDVLRDTLERGVDSGVFVGASAAVAYRAGDRWCAVQVARGAAGEGLGRVSTSTVYDLASLTKPCVALAALRLVAAGTVRLQDPVGHHVEELTELPSQQLTIQSLLSHRSGLEAWAPFYEQLPVESGSDAAVRWIVSEAGRRWEATREGDDVYSDLGYILLGVALSRCSGKTLDQLVREEVTSPIGIDQDVFFASNTPGPWRARCAPTGLSPWRGRSLGGEVHDDNCAALGGIAGHAGMFGTARGVLRLGTEVIDVLRGRSDFLPRHLIEQSLEPMPGGSHRLGWDGKADEGSAAGERLSARSFGHLGFTGTSLWCDPERELAITLLSNRVYPDIANVKIRAFRPRYHDAVAEAFDDSISRS